MLEQWGPQNNNADGSLLSTTMVCKTQRAIKFKKAREIAFLAVFLTFSQFKK